MGAGNKGTIGLAERVPISPSMLGRSILEALMPDPLPFDDIPLDEQARQYRALIEDLEERLRCARTMLAVVQEQIEIEARYGA